MLPIDVALRFIHFGALMLILAMRYTAHGRAVFAASPDDRRFQLQQKTAALVSLATRS
jgi:hypothetical protein